MTHPNTLLRCITIASLGLANTAFAAGFALIEQSVSNMGVAYAGGGALATDSSALFFNPAGMTRLPGTRASAGVQLIDPHARFSNTGSAFALTSAPIPGSNGGDNGAPTPVPHTYLTHQVKDDVWLGLTVNVPFGLSTEYSADWVGRYHSIESSIQTYNVNPSIAVRVNDQVSLAGGISGQYLSADLSNAIDFGTLNQLPQAAGGLGGVLGAGVGPGDADGAVKLEGDSFGWGFNIGALLQLDDATRVSAHYRSEVDHEVEGDAVFTLPTPALGAAFPNTGVKSDVTLPATASLSVHHRIDSRFAIMADYTWTGWSSLPELRFVFDSASGLPDGVTTFDWKDTSRIAVGGTYQAQGSPWIVRTGLAYDESPVRNAGLRTPRLPDADRWWLTLGAGAQLTPRLSIDFGYAYLYIDDPRIASAVNNENVPRGILVGEFESSVNIVAVQMEYLLD